MSHVVMIDGDLGRRAGISMALRSVGCDVLEVDDATAGLTVALRRPVDWVLCSWPMVGLEARTLARAMRAETRLKGVPLFAYCPAMNPSMELEILSTGFDSTASGLEELRALDSWKARSIVSSGVEVHSGIPGRAISGTVSMEGKVNAASEGRVSELSEFGGGARPRESLEVWLGALLDVVTDPVFVHDPAGRILEVNSHACTALGYGREEFLSLNICDLESVRDAGAARGIVEGGRGESVVVNERRGNLRRKDGTWLPVESRVGVLEWHGTQYFLLYAKDITQRLGAEANLEERDRKLNMAIEAGNVGLWDWDLLSNRVWFSPEWKRQIGYLDHEIQDTYEEWRSRLHPDDVERALATLRDCLGGVSGRYENEFRFCHKSGSYRWILARGTLIKSADGRPIRILGAHLDISERKQVEEAQRHGEERYRRLFDENPQPMWLYDRETLRFIAVNEAAVRHYGYSREEFLAMRILDISPPEEVPRLLKKLHQTPTGFDHAGVWKHRKKDGTLIDVDVSAHSVMLGARRTELALANDVTRRRQAEQRVRQLNRIYAVLSDMNKLIVREREAQVILEGACRIAVERGGFRMAWIGRLDPLTQQVHPVASSGIVDGYLDLLDINLSDPQRCTGPVGKSILGARHEVANDLETDDGFVRWRDLALSKGFRSAASFVLSPAPGRTPVGILCLYSGTRNFFDEEEVRLLDELAADISFALEGCEREEERKRAERAMRDSEERFRQLTETIDDVFWMTDPRTQEVIYVSPAYERIWGRPCSELRESPMAWLEAVHPEDRPKLAQVQLDGRQAEIRSDEYRIIRPDGQIRWIRDRAFPVVGSGNEVTRVVGAARDVTDLRQLEEQLRQSQKLEAIGQLAGGVAHDFNNILAAILMQVELAGWSPGLSADLSESLDEIRLSAQRAVALTRQLLLFGRKQVMQRCRVDLNGIVENLARMLQRIIGEDIRLQLTLDPQPVMASADAGMVDQVLLNLAVNSRDAMPRGGDCRLRRVGSGSPKNMRVDIRMRRRGSAPS